MRAAIYVRQSLDKSGEALAVGRQLAECRELAERNGWDVSEIYSDNDTSATSRKPRPEWSRLLSDLDAGRHDVLLCWHTDRLYRRLRDLVDLVEIAERRALRIASVKAADIDLSTPAGRMLAGMLGHAARYEVEQKGARQVAANRARAKAGTVLWSRRPFGFDREGSAVRIVKSEADEIRKAADTVLSGGTLASVAADLNGRGVPTSTGARWSVTSVRRLLLNPRTAGRVVYKGEDMGGNDLAILDPDTADRLAGLLRDPRRRASPSTQVKYLLSGLVRCGREDCGAVMFATKNRPGTPPNGKRANASHIYRCTSCHLTRRLEAVDEVVRATVIARLSRPDAADLLTQDADLDGLRAQVTERRDRRDGLASLLADGLLSRDAVRVQARKLTDEIDELERQIDAATGTNPLALVIDSQDVAATFDALPILKRREIIKALMEVRIMPVGKGIRFDPEHVEIEWKGQACEH